MFSSLRLPLSDFCIMVSEEKGIFANRKLHLPFLFVNRKFLHNILPNSNSNVIYLILMHFHMLMCTASTNHFNG